MVTINDVAHEARVSVGTVSKVINSRPGVALETRARVQEAIARLNYHCDSSARGLRTRRTMMLGIVVPFLNHEYTQGIIAGAENTAAEFGYNVVVCNSQKSAEREYELVKLFLRRQVDGLLIALPRMDDPGLARLAAEGVPLAVVGRQVHGDLSFPVVTADNGLGIRQAVAHLAGEHGRRRIAYLHGAVDDMDDAARFAGYCQGLSDAGLAFDPELTGYGGHSEEDMAGEALARMIRLGHQPDAVVCFDDSLAIGVYRMASRLGLAIPEDLAVIGVNDSQIARYLTPKLCSVTLPTQGMGELATRKLIGMLNNGREGAGIHVLPTGIVTRGSCGCRD
ncbi:MAG: LacI family DNA-binding transcriptional regulator [Patescibacteria group bacterium]